MGKEKKRIGTILIDAGLIDEYQLSAAIGHQKQWGGRLVNILINRGFVDEQTVISVLKKQLGVKSASLEGIKISQKALDKVKHDIAEKYSIMPLDLDNKKLTIAMSDPTDLQVIDELSFMLGINIEPLLAAESSIKKAIAEHYTGAKDREGYTYRAAIEKPPEEMDILRAEKTMKEMSYSDEITISAITEILIEKGLITKEELTNKIHKKLGQ